MIKGVGYHIDLYTDGATSPNPGFGGFAAVLIARTDLELIKQSIVVGSVPHATNIQMELMGAIAGLEAFARPCKPSLYTDSKHVKDGITDWLPKWQRNGWRTASGDPVKNKDLWQRLVAAETRHIKVNWQWVRGHGDNEFNNLADRWAVLARECQRDGHILCQWCKDRPSILNVPCPQCTQLGAKSDANVRVVRGD